MTKFDGQDELRNQQVCDGDHIPSASDEFVITIVVGFVKLDLVRLG